VKEGKTEVAAARSFALPLARSFNARLAAMMLMIMLMSRGEKQKRRSSSKKKAVNGNEGCGGSNSSISAKTEETGETRWAATTTEVAKCSEQ
jgi:hypothetical protein